MPVVAQRFVFERMGWRYLLGGKTGSRYLRAATFAIGRRCISEIKKISVSPAARSAAVTSCLPDTRCKQDGICMHIQSRRDEQRSRSRDLICVRGGHAKEEVKHSRVVFR